MSHLSHDIGAVTRPPIPPTPPSRGIEGAIARASARTGVDFSYLLEKASTESSLNPTARSKNSSASGLYQFIETTWLEMVRNYGHKYGLDQYAECIDQNCQVKNPRMRQTILNLRHDPETSACMAAEYAARNAEILKSRIGPDAQIGQTELFLAHFLGAGGATKFLTALDKNPDARAASLFPAEARTNRGVFYNSETGRARTLAQIYDRFSRRFNELPPQEDNAMNPAISRTDLRPPRRLDTQNNLLSTSPGTAECANENIPDIEITASSEWVEGAPLAALTPEFVEELLATPPRSLDPKDNPLAAATALKQSALLVLAQNFAHTENDRYNG